MSSDPLEYNWQCYPQTAAWVQQQVQRARQDVPLLDSLAERMRHETGTDVCDWLDHLVVPENEVHSEHLQQLGYERSAATEHRSDHVWIHPGGMFPAIRLGQPHAVALKVESVVDFLFAHQLTCDIHGQPMGPLRTAKVASGAEGTELWVVERHGSINFRPTAVTPRQITAALAWQQRFTLRRRHFESESDGFACLTDQVQAAIEQLGVAWACDLFFAAERRYWQSRNRAARIQRARQDRLGLGWANHDHHTYRCSRAHFTSLIELLELLGFECRERFYGGAQAGWGAQVLEQPRAGVVVFADVDLSASEVSGDFAHEGLAPRDGMGTVGLWCALHGEAIFAAGMHHLECQFDFAGAQQQLSGEGVNTMAPFTDFDHLKQAFTEGERWPVAESRIEQALQHGWITAEQAEQFRERGSIGSHLEILQRRDGYKGFNQTGISEIIRQTDPRRAASA